jgi:hypothetical protein
MFEAAGRHLEKSDFFLVVESMKREEVHPAVIAVLDRIAALLPDASAATHETTAPA